MAQSSLKRASRIPLAWSALQQALLHACRDDSRSQTRSRVARRRRDPCSPPRFDPRARRVSDRDRSMEDRFFSEMKSPGSKEKQDVCCGRSFTSARYA